MTQIYILRHGETDSNVRRSWHTGGSGSINDRGRQQAVLVANEFKKFGLDAVISSDSIRAMETASIVSEITGTKYYGSNKIFRERDFGDADDLTTPEILGRFGIIVNSVMDTGADELPGSESLHDLERRVGMAKNFICNQFPDDSVLVVTHGGFSRMFYKTFVGDIGGKYFQNCSYFSVSCDSMGCRLMIDLSSIT